ncbi:tetratricopeptide repeat protein, partial [Thiohalocapsa sp.]|uniref:tetratricopeptide repeat protein n=1 Tax=Thiohalocapsa sp. TaxID=2497641 RepID=UPI0025DB0D66
HDMGQLDLAIKHYQQALIIARDICDQRNEGAWLGNLGLVYAELGLTEQAIKHHQRAWAILEEIRSPIASQIRNRLKILRIANFLPAVFWRFLFEVIRIVDI